MDKAVETIDKTIDPKMAAVQPSTINPGTTAAAINNITALITKAKRPKVIMVIGRVISSKIGLIKVLTKPKTIPAKIAVVKSATFTPGTI